MRMKFISLNLWLGGMLFEKILKFMEQERPDIFVVQEAYNSVDLEVERRFRSIEVIKKQAGFEHAFFAPACIAKLKEGDMEAGNAIFSKFPILETKDKFFDVPFGDVANYEEPGGDYSRTPRNIQHAKLNIEGNELNVFNTQGIWGRGEVENQRRLQMVTEIMDFVNGKENVVLAGDFNFTDDSEPVRILEKQLDNVFKGKIKTSFNISQKKNPVFESLVIDMIFVSKDIKIIDSHASQVDISDHLPLVCELEV